LAGKYTLFTPTIPTSFPKQFKLDLHPFQPKRNPYTSTDVYLVAHGAAVIYACSHLPSEPYAELADAVNAQYPNTKVIGYPYKITSEEDTLALIDDVLNTWGRYVSLISYLLSFSRTSPYRCSVLFVKV
jgi:hypothetical protein